MENAQPNFENLIIFEMANNHQGDLIHGLRIIESLGDLVKKESVTAAVKFQFRHLETFIHPEHRETSTNKHIPRFLSTRLSLNDYTLLKEKVESLGMLSICTPFDEPSVDHIMELDFDIIKVASCSAADWPLIEKIKTTGKPVIVSTAGAPVENVDKLVAFFGHELVGLLHCVAIYPTPPEHLQLHRIAEFKNRYPSLTVGFSTHESPEDVSTVQMAYALGARVFEKHVGLPNAGSSLNSYSAQPSQLALWIQALKEAIVKFGSQGATFTKSEMESLAQLNRGVFLRQPVKKNAILSRDDVYFAMPLAGPQQLTSGQWKNELVADHDYAIDEPLSASTLSPSSSETRLCAIRAQVSSLLRSAHVVLPLGTEGYISHHQGLDSFDSLGATIFTLFNNAVCKKIIILLPGQKHPKHMHQTREETFQILSGDLNLHLNEKTVKLKVGDIFHIPAATWHEFGTDHGAVVEETSTTYQEGDSIYENTSIDRIEHHKRKTAF